MKCNTTLLCSPRRQPTNDEYLHYAIDYESNAFKLARHRLSFNESKSLLSKLATLLLEIWNGKGGRHRLNNYK